MNSSNLVYIHQNRTITNSKLLAEHFGKEHRNVLRDIRRIVADMQDPEFIQLNFELKEINTLQGLETDCYEMTQDGFTLVAMGFTGKKALGYKKQYIQEFNRMSQELLKHGQSPKSNLDLLKLAVQDLERLEAEKSILTQSVKTATTTILTQQTEIETNKGKSVAMVLTFSLPAWKVYNTYPNIRKAVDSYISKKKNPSQWQTPGATTMVLLMNGLERVLSPYNNKNQPHSVFSKSDVENLEAKLGETK